jgi:rhodanese-related sulfurtransferase
VKTLLAFVAALCLGACFRSELPPRTQTPAPTNKDPAAARELVAAGAVVIDVRTADEYAEAHLSHAINIPVQELPDRIAEIETLVAGDRTRPIVVYCAAGSRAAKAKAQLDAAGYSNVVNGGGLGDLLAGDRP